MPRLALAVLIALGLSLPLSAADGPRKPNILFIFTDDHASHAISAYGSKINQTPNLDRIAKEGMRFENCFCTNSICGPSRAVILTGKHSHLNGFPDNKGTTVFDGSQQTFPKLLQAAGYQTAMLGKWHLKSEPTGFDRWTILNGQGTYYNPTFRTDKGPIKVEGYTTEIVTDITLDWLQKERDKDKPFLLMYQHKAPHREWAPGPNQLGLYRDKDIPEPDTLFDDWAGHASPSKDQEMTIARHMSDRDMKFVAPGNLTPAQKKVWDAAYAKENEAFKAAKLTGKDLVRWKYQRYIKDYLRCVAGVDENVGRVLKYLDDSGLAKDTIVIYSSDQGFYLGDRGWYDKRWMYEESLKMPLLVRWPGVIKPGSVNTDLVQNLDFASTFLDIAGVKIPADMQGESLVPLMKGKTPDDWRMSIYYQYYEYPQPHKVAPHWGVRTATHKLMYFPLTREWELFDLVKDPGERTSIYADPAAQETVKKLKAEIDRLRTMYKVPEGVEAPKKPTGK